METRLVTAPHIPGPDSLGRRWKYLGEASFARTEPARLIQLLGEDGVELNAAANAGGPLLPPEETRSLYEWMVLVRVFDFRMVNLQRQGRISFFVPSLGEEALQIGTIAALRTDDWIFPAYREQGVALFRGYPMETLICQFMGNSGDFLRGRQMPNHYGAPHLRFAVASSPIGTQIPQAVGAAWTARIRREETVSAVYFGDGTTSSGDFHAGLTFAATQQLPVVFFCKNNGWAISHPVAKQTRAECIADKAHGYGMPGLRVDGNDLLAVYDVSMEAAEWARSGSGPVLVELVTQRMGPHSTSDDPARYRDPSLLEPWKKRDPLHRLRAYLESHGLWSAEDEERITRDADARVTEALRLAEPMPPPTVASLFEDVYAEMPWHLREQLAEAEQAEALRRLGSEQ